MSIDWRKVDAHEKELDNALNASIQDDVEYNGLVRSYGMQYDFEDYIFPALMQPMVLVTKQKDHWFKKGLATGLQKVRDTMCEQAAQAMARIVRNGEFPLDPFQSRKQWPCYGATVYVLTRDEMCQLEDLLRAEIKKEMKANGSA